MEERLQAAGVEVQEEERGGGEEEERKRRRRRREGLREDEKRFRDEIAW